MAITPEGFVTLPPGANRSGGGGGLPFVGTGLEGLGPALAQFGQVLGGVLDPSKMLREQITSKAALEPEFAASIGRAVRKAEEEGRDPNIFASLNISPEFTQGIAALSADTPEVKTEKSRTEALRATERATTATQTAVERQTTFGLTQGLPELTAQDQIQKIQEQIRTNTEAARLNLGPALIRQQGALARLGLEQTEFARSNQQALEKLVVQLPPEEQTRFLLATTADAFLKDVQFRESLSSRENLANLARSAAGAKNNLDFLKDMVTVTTDINGEMVKLAGAISATSPGEGNLREELNRRFNTLANVAAVVDLGLSNQGVNVFGKGAELSSSVPFRQGPFPFLPDIGLANQAIFNIRGPVGGVAFMVAKNPELIPLISQANSLDPAEKADALKQLAEWQRLQALPLQERIHDIFENDPNAPEMTVQAPSIVRKKSGGG